ncbi:MAG TPA: bifunctional diaminohydroxyphosphoribosylaminopyrimidine deaminase/5-amino-6-(5-phosphoribosylamino)uracil reductase RibD [Mycobacteriales bacterium]|nr:bifunctional diaminohydroxyphosphoribosylaminopyrimidine deaminase/5-amino-6-(5-phosphoribosylamino)uracil reductase RibD [Mycobacteriales bacterium]
MAASPAEHAAMRRAVDLAARGRGVPHPNPLVGAVVLTADGDVAGEGWHARDRVGAPHAEVAALAAAGDRARGGTVVTTLEPCSHHGSTGPCTTALLDAGVRRVVVAVPEPTRAAGGGADLLRAADVEVVVGVEEDLARRGNEAWLHAIAHGRPFVTLKVAATIDGRVAASDGTSQWITSPEARADAHLLRAECDAVAVGIGTVLADDPRLTVRDRAGRLAGRQPLRVVFDSEGRTPSTAQVAAPDAPTWVLIADDRTPPPGPPTYLPVARAADGLALEPALKALHAAGVQHLLVEGGPRLAGSFVDAGYVDRVVAYVAPALMGSGRPAVECPLGTPTITGLARLRIDSFRQVGPDLRIDARPAGSG